MKIYLIDRNFHKFSYLKAYLGREDVVLVNDSFENFISKNYVQCVVSPANSFGLMDGGYDLALINWYGEQFEYSSAAKPPVRCGGSHLSGLTEPLVLYCHAWV